RERPTKPAHEGADDRKITLGSDVLHLAEYWILADRKLVKVTVDILADDHGAPYGAATAAGQTGASLHSAQWGLRAKQTRRPCQISWWASSIHFCRGISAMRSCSIFRGSDSRVSPRRPD